MSIVQSKHEKSVHFTLKQRREQVLDRLAAVGLVRGPRRVLRAGDESETSFGLKLRLVLGDLGPIFSSFGRYLATRVDLLPSADCLALEGIADDSLPMSEVNVVHLIEREIGSAPDEVFSFETAPFESRLLHQLHHARLRRNGMPVVVKLVRPEVTAQLLCDLEVLDLIAPMITGPVRDEIYKSAVAGFAAELGQEMDLTNEAKGLATLQRDAEDFEMIRVPDVLGNLSSSSMLTTECLTGLSSDELEVLDRQNLARLLCSAWLRQALVGHVFPVGPRPANVTFISNRQIAFTGGALSSLSGASQANLWSYLIASSGESPDRACSSLLREFCSDGPQGADEELRQRFRQIVPFRDSGWYSDDNPNRLIAYLVVHWQAAKDCGFVPQTPLTSFYRGLFAISRMAQQLSPSTDALVEGLQEARLLESVARMREMVSWQCLGNYADRYVAMMMAMPQKLDQVLALASDGGARVKLHVPETHQRQKNSMAVMTAMLLLLAAIAFAIPRLTTSLISAHWAGRVNAILFIGCGALFLLAVRRTS